MITLNWGGFFVVVFCTFGVALNDIIIIVDHCLLIACYLILLYHIPCPCYGLTICAITSIYISISWGILKHKTSFVSGCVSRDKNSHFLVIQT